LLLQSFHIADFSSTDSLVLDACEEVEADFGGGVAANAPLEYRYNLVWKFLACAGAVEDRSGLETIEFVELVVY
jgi:hypothetical protein